MEQLDQVEHENLGNDMIRLEMGKKREEERPKAPAAEPSEEGQTTPFGRIEARKAAVAALPQSNESAAASSWCAGCPKPREGGHPLGGLAHRGAQGGNS